jgi:hypothetical protein
MFPSHNASAQATAKAAHRRHETRAAFAGRMQPIVSRLILRPVEVVFWHLE